MLYLAQSCGKEASVYFGERCPVREWRGCSLLLLILGCDKSLWISITPSRWVPEVIFFLLNLFQPTFWTTQIITIKYANVLSTTIMFKEMHTQIFCNLIKSGYFKALNMYCSYFNFLDDIHLLLQVSVSCWVHNWEAGLSKVLVLLASRSYRDLSLIRHARHGE